MNQPRFYPEKDFLSQRRRGVGGSDVGAIMGLSKFSSPLQCYLSKVGEVEQEDNFPMWFGREVEPLVVKRYEQVNTLTVFCAPKTIVPTVENQRMICEKNPEVDDVGDLIYYYHPDGLLMSEPASCLLHPLVVGGFEAKTSGRFGAWGDTAKEIPPEVYAQVQWGMFVCDLPWFDVAVFLGNREYKQYRIKRNRVFAKKMTAAVNKFWRDHVLKQIPPVASGADKDKELLQTLYEATEGVMTPTVGDFGTIEKIGNLRKQMQELKGELQTHENALKSRLGSHTMIVTDRYRITWKQGKETQTVDWELVADFLSRHVTDAEYGMCQQDNTTTKAGSRRFLFKELSNGE